MINRLLFVGCYNLGPEASVIVRNHFPNADIKLWRRGDQEELQRVRQEILSDEWPVLMSFYNDYLFTPEELTKVSVALNIHPSLERGRGYDTIPLIEDHTHHGIMMHYVNEKIDFGTIIEVEEVPIPAQIGYKAFRRRNQELCLGMLDRYLSEIKTTDTVEELDRSLKARAEALNRPWGDRYVSAKYLGKTLRQLRESDPRHRVFDGLPEEIIQFGNDQVPISV